jgi:hypothetical protein
MNNEQEHPNIALMRAQLEHDEKIKALRQESAPTVELADTLFKRQPAKRGLTEFLKLFTVGETRKLGKPGSEFYFSQTSIGATGLRLGMKFATRTIEGELYVKRIS